jgi:hypothetical protein
LRRRRCVGIIPGPTGYAAAFLRRGAAEARVAVRRAAPNPRRIGATRSYEAKMSAYDIRLVNEMVERESGFLDRLMSEVHKVIVGQDEMIERVFMGLLCGGHVLLEGAPGLA